MTDIRIPHPSELRKNFGGDLVELEPLAASHAEELYEAAQDGDLFAWLPEDLGDRTAFCHWLTWSMEAAEAVREVPFAIRSSATNRLVGSTRFHEIRLEHLRVEIGWTWLAESAHRTGINVETKLLLLTHTFENVGCRRVEFKADARNRRSCGALEKLGTRYEGTFRKHMVVRDGAVRDSAYYSVIDDHWPEVKAQLRRRLHRAGPSPDS
jgi:RimJ/RimL family protein N-acetyltransferase